ncbi:MAG: hypothetical protein ACYDHO_03665, partial [Gaiellaceae bacterium]
LPHRGNYYWSVQAVNGSLVGSLFAQEMKFIVPGRVSLNVSKRKINSCGDAPLTTAATGRVSPIFTPGATIILKKRLSPGGAWREIERGRTGRTGIYGFHYIGKSSSRSFWLKVVVTPTGGGSIASRPRHVTVSMPASCRAEG